MAYIDSQLRIHIDDDETPLAGWAVLRHGRVDPNVLFATEAQAKMYTRMSGSGNSDIVPVTIRGRIIDRNGG